MEKEKICAFALSEAFRYEPAVARAIIENLGNAASVFELGKDGLGEIFGPDIRHADIIAGADLEQAEKTLENAEKMGFRYIAYYEPDFSLPLNQCADAPCGLFIRSGADISGIFSGDCIAIVGTRDMSSYGSAWCGNVVRCLGESDTRPKIVSGLAFGVDVTAHRNALDCGLPTIAVLGTPIDKIYPHEHSGIARRIEASPGCAIISEYAPGTPTDSISFLRRNRIIAGLCRATVLIESKLKGGGMSTARMASSYDRSVFALPGRLDDLRSQGCNALVHGQIAEPLIGCKEFLKSLDYKNLPGRKAKSAGIAEFYASSTDRFRIRMMEKLYALIHSRRDISASQLCEISGMDYKDVCSALGTMESDGFITVDLLQRCSIRLH